MKQVFFMTIALFVFFVGQANAQPIKKHESKQKKSHYKDADGIDGRMRGPNGEKVFIGEKGGRYYLNDVGNKVYINAKNKIQKKKNHLEK